MTSFPVSNVRLTSEPLEESSAADAIAGLIKPEPSEGSFLNWNRYGSVAVAERTSRLVAGIEACSRHSGRLVAGVAFHPVIAALHLGFMDHRPVSLSPDMIWLMVVQGVANHINNHAETLRPRFVKHAGKVNLSVRRDDFIKGTDNPWIEVFQEFGHKVRDHIGATTYDFFVDGFSTTGAAEKAAFEISLLDAMQSYFTYTLRTFCGIPEITLEGTPQDWRLILNRIQMLPRFDMGWWMPALQVILEQFVEASEGRSVPMFWESIYKFQMVSGGSRVSGWISAFFPYLTHAKTRHATRRNEWGSGAQQDLEGLLKDKPTKMIWPDDGAPSIDDFPIGLSSAPFMWEYWDDHFKMEFLGGFIGVQQDPKSLCLRPEIGWAVRESS